MTTQATSKRRLGRSLLSIFIGAIVVILLSLGTDQVLHLTKIYPPWGQLMSDSMFGLALAYRIIFGILGSYITARLAPYRPMLHSLTGAAVGMLLTALATIGTWNKPEMGPHWYPILLILTALPCAWLGAKLFTRHQYSTVSAA